MVSYQKLKHVVGDKLLVEAVCLSTDAKPTENIADSSRCTEQDTGKKYLFNSGTWYNVTEDMPVEIEEPTLITLTQDTDIIDLATKAYNGEVLVQWYIDEADDTMPLPPPLLMPCSPLVIPTDANNPFIVGFAANIIYRLGNRPDDSPANNMKPVMLVCFLRSTPNMHITKDDATVCGILTDMADPSFSYLSIEDFSEKYLAPKFLVTSLYSKQQQTHSVLLVVPRINEHDVRFCEGATEAELKIIAVEDGMLIPEEEIPKGYDFWTELPNVEGQHYSDADIAATAVPGDLNFYGWRESTIWLGDGATGNGLYQGQYVNGSVLPYNDIVNAVPRIAEYTHWFTDIDHNVPVDDITTETINGNTDYFGWVGDPNEKTGGE